MATSTKLEFAAQMTCQSCVDSIQKVLKNKPDIDGVTVNLEKEQILVETSLSSWKVQEIIETTGKRAVLLGLGPTSGNGHLGAAVSMLDGRASVQGVARLVQVSPELCVIDGTVDGLTPGQYGVYVHELGDLSKGCDSCGDVFNMGTHQQGQKRYGDLCSVKANDSGRAEFRIESSRIKVWDIIGRSMVIQREDGPNRESKNRVACGILARSAGLFQNPKRICACDGVPLWDERDVPIAGGKRQNYRPANAQL